MGLAVVGLAALLGVGDTASSGPLAYDDLGVFVSFPRNIRPGELLTIKITAGGGGCASYDRLTVDRSLAGLDIHVQMRRPSAPPVACTAEAVAIPLRYVDGLRGVGTPLEVRELPPSVPGQSQPQARQLQIVVNGKSWGAVVVR